jgi:hypothetical protein
MSVALVLARRAMARLNTSIAVVIDLVSEQVETDGFGCALKAVVGFPQPRGTPVIATSCESFTRKVSPICGLI